MEGDEGVLRGGGVGGGSIRDVFGGKNERGATFFAAESGTLEMFLYFCGLKRG